MHMHVCLRTALINIEAYGESSSSGFCSDDEVSDADPTGALAGLKSTSSGRERLEEQRHLRKWKANESVPSTKPTATPQSMISCHGDGHCFTATTNPTMNATRK
jgi:hypothetical protein